MKDVTEDITANEVTWSLGGATAKRRFFVVARSVDEARAKPNVPREGHLYRNKMGQILNPFLVANQVRVTTRTPSAPGATSLYVIDVDYGVPSANSRQPLPGEKAIANWRTVRERVPTDVALDDPTNPTDARDVPIAYLNGDIADPQITMLVVRAELTLNWIAKNFGFMQYFHLLTSLNASEFYGIPTVHGHLTDLNESQREDGYLNCSMTVEVAANDYDHWGRVLDVEANAVISYFLYYIKPWIIPVPGVTT